MQTGLLLPRTGVADAPFTTTEPVPTGPTQPDTVAKTEYVPEAKVVAPTITGFCEAEEKLFGPDQEYTPPANVVAVKLKSPPTQTGVLLPTVGAVGVGVIVTEVTLGGVLTHPFAPVAVTE